MRRLAAAEEGNQRTRADLSARRKTYVSLPEESARWVLLMASVELADRDRILVGEHARLEASEAATAAVGDAASQEQWLVERARKILDGGVLRSAPTVRRWLTWIRPRRSAKWLPISVGFLAGLGSNALGPSHAVNILAMPLLLVIAWNMAVMSTSLVASWIPIGRVAFPSIPAGIRGWFSRSLERWLSRAPEISFGGSDQATAWRDALARFSQDWIPAVTLLSTARIRRTLHLAALALIVGMVAGMYVRGIGLSYRATWESTFLRPQDVGGFLETVLAPASELLRLPVPSVAELESPRAGDAAPWIHLFAATALLFVVLPRTVFVVFAERRVRHCKRNVQIPISRAYLRRLRAASDRSRTVVDLIPYSYLPGDRALSRLKALLLDLFGASVELRSVRRIDYGEVHDLGDDAETAVVLFGLAQTPESEVHGKWLRGVAATKEVLVVVDASKYRTAASEARVAERRRSWTRVVEESGLVAAHIDLNKARTGHGADESLERLAECFRRIESRE